VEAGEAVDLADANRSNGANGENPPLWPVLGDIQARLAEVDAHPQNGLVVGLWKPLDDLCVVALAGEMDMSNATEVTELLDGCLGAGPSRLVVEVSRLTFKDSTGVNQLVTVSRPLKERGGETLLVAPTAHVARVFEIVKLDELITVVDSLEGALTRDAVAGAAAEGERATSPPASARKRSSRTS
jgi:anti-sigma B factor antagonist